MEFCFVMLKKYNFALLPKYNLDKFIRLSHLFQDESSCYVLGECSHPHVTLFFFEADEVKIENIWDAITRSLSMQSLTMEFIKFSYISFDENIYWISLLPKEQETLKRLHSAIAKLIHLPIKDTYDPHLTLINTENKTYQKKINEITKNYQPILEDFVLSLGERDECGQFIKILYQAGAGKKSYL